MAITVKELQEYARQQIQPEGSIEDVGEEFDTDGKWVSVEKILSHDEGHTPFPGYDPSKVQVDHKYYFKGAGEWKILEHPEIASHPSRGRGPSLKVRIPKTPSPPKAAAYFALLIPKANREFLLGDFMEQYWALESKRGSLAARWWLYKQMIASVWSIAFHGINNLARRFTK